MEGLTALQVLPLPLCTGEEKTALENPTSFWNDGGGILVHHLAVFLLPLSSCSFSQTARAGPSATQAYPDLGQEVKTQKTVHFSVTGVWSHSLPVRPTETQSHSQTMSVDKDTEIASRWLPGALNLSASALGSSTPGCGSSSESSPSFLAFSPLPQSGTHWVALSIFLQRASLNSLPTRNCLNFGLVTSLLRTDSRNKQTDRNLPSKKLDLDFSEDVHWSTTN